MDWRSSLTAQARQEVILKLIEVVKLAAPSQDQAKLAELAASTEQAIFEKSKNRQEYILFLQQKISNLQAKIAVIQKNQGSFASPSLSNQYPSNPSYLNQSTFAQSAPSKPLSQGVVPPVIAPKYQPMTGIVPANLRNMVLNLQQQQAQNIQNSIKSQQTAHQAIQAAKIAQKTLMGVQMQSNMTALASSPPIQASVPNSIQASNNSPASTNNSMAFPSLNLSDAQRSEVTEKLKQILPLYQKIDLIINYLSASEQPSKINIQKLAQLKTLLTEQFKHIKKRIFLSPEGLDNIHDFLVKMLKNAEEFQNSKISTPKQTPAQTPTPIQKSISQPESISNGFRYAIEQEMSFKKSSKSDFQIEISTTSPYEWSSELKMYGIEEENHNFSTKLSSQTIFQDYNILFGPFELVQEKTDLFEPDLQSIDSKISNLETLGFIITRLQDYNNFQVLLVKNPTAGWSIIVHIFDNLIQEWQFLDTVSVNRESLDGYSKTLDRDLLQGKGIEMIQFLKFTK